MGIDMVKEGNQWIGLVTGYASNKLYRLNFGTDLTNSPVVTDISGVLNLNLPMSLKILKQGQNFHVFVVNNAGGEFPFLRLDFGNSLLNTPAETQISISGSNQLTTIDIEQQCDQWFGFIVSRANQQIFRLDFGTDITNNPITTEVGSLTGVSFNDPGGLAAVQEGDSSYVFVQSRNGPLYKLHFGKSYANDPSGTDLGNIYGGDSRTWGLEFVKMDSEWYGFNVSFRNRLYRLDFPSNCSAPSSIATEFEPSDISYSSSGLQFISLKAFDDNEKESTFSLAVNVSPEIAPNIDFSTDGSCVISPFDFIGASPSSIVSWNWDFGDGQTDDGQNVNHIYSASGTYNVSLSASDGVCSNRMTRPIEVLDQPNPTFSIPAGQLCSNVPYTFTNTTSQNLGSNVMWEWQVNGADVSNDQDLVHPFTTTGSQDIKLIATIPGCSGETSQSVSGIIEGANTNFVAEDHCFGNGVPFDNLTSGGAGNTFLWDFGNGFTSTQENPLYQYPTAGQYTATLTTTSANGCVTFSQKNVQTFSLPQPNFSVDLPPFSCSNSPAQFNNLTPAPNDDNIAFWLWEFADGSGATSHDPAPTYIYDLPGNYPVRLTARTSFGCEVSVEKNAAIAEGPLADFDFSPACLDEEVQFTDLSVAPSTGTITKWFWEIDGQGFFTQNPTYTFSTPADHNVKLTVTSNNECVKEITRILTVNPVPNVDFNVENTCTGSPTMFTDLTQPIDDPIATHTWDFNGLGNANTPNAEFQFPIPGEYTVDLTLQTEAGCQYGAAKSFAVNPSPQAAFEAVPAVGTPPLVVQFTNQSNGADAFQWFFTNTNEPQGSETSPTYTYDELGEYDATLVASNSAGCTDTAKQRISAVEAALDIELRQINVIPVNDQSQIILTIANNGKLPVSEMDILIDLGGEVVVNELFTGNVNPGELTNYTLGFRLTTMVTTRYFCVKLVPDTGFEELNLSDNQRCQNLTDQTITIAPFPNPVADRLRVQVVLAEPEPITLSLFDNRGKETVSRSFSATTTGLNDFGIVTSHLEKGFYLLRVVTASKSETFRVLINH